MNRVMKYVALATLATPVAASAAQDFSAVNRDVSVMSQILTGAFKSQDRRGAHASVSGTYLAGQGAVFTIRSYGAFTSYSFQMGNDSDNGNVFFYQSGDDNNDDNDDDDDADAPAPPAPPAPSAAPAPAPVIDPGDLDELGSNIAMSVLGNTGFAMHDDHMGREIRSAMRDVARQLRDIDQQISDNRIELIHTDKDENRKKLEAQIADLEKKRDQVDGKREKLEKQLDDARKKVEAERKEMVEKARQAREEQLARTVNVVMESLCAYGSTLKNVPDNEHVSVVIDGRSASGDNHHVYVMGKKDVAQCKSGGADGLAKGAVSYSY